jgi:energy-coupling factor transport system permease protein
MSPPDYLRRPRTAPYQRLNPATKLVITFALATLAFTLRGWTGPLAVLVLAVTCAAVAGVARGLVPFALATLPLVASILAVNTLFFPGATDTLFSLGPLQATGTGLRAALLASLRVVAFALAVALLSLTTPTDDLLCDLERRGLGQRALFILGSALGLIPRLAGRAREISEAQRARGLDTEGPPWRRVRGLLPLAGPLIASALYEAEERALALEARAFPATHRRPLLRVLPDSRGERLARHALLLTTALLSCASLAGLPRVP